MRTETLVKLLSKLSNLFNRRVKVRLDGVVYAVSHIEHRDNEDIIVICKDNDD